MKKLIFILCTLSLCFLLTGKVYSQKSDRGLRQINHSLIKEYIYYLASDSLKGRATPGKELDKAADFIAGQFEKFKVGKVGGSYFQNVPYCSLDLDKNRCIFKISRLSQDASSSFDLKKDYIPFIETADKSVSSELVFAGYGITAPEYNYDDYSGVDVKGKIVVILKHEPGENDANSVFKGKKWSVHSYMKTKFDNALKHGAAGIIVLTDPLNHILLSPQGFSWPCLSRFASPNKFYMIEEDNANVPVIDAGESVINSLFGSVDSLKKIQAAIDSLVKPNSFLFKGLKCDLSTAVNTDRVFARNVVGYIKGSDKKLSDELVVVGGHYDHVGYKKNHKEGEDYIFNGADDNASGTAGVLSIAKAFSSLKKKPARSILFILFEGEENGLDGSNYYCEHPLLPLDKTVAMLNLDMISRNGDTLQIEGSQYNPDLFAIIMNENRSVGLKFVPTGDEFFQRSDHYNFFRKGITAMDICAGIHKDYHTVNDNPDRTNPEKAAKISQLIYRTAKVIANDNKRYMIIQPKNNN